MVTEDCAGTSAPTPECGEGSLRALTDRTATCQFERVRALRRATQSAMDAAKLHARSSAPLARRAPHDGSRSHEARRRFDGGGPSPLTEDRQKPKGKP